MNSTQSITTSDNNYSNKKQSLKIVFILSFIMCGLNILFHSFTIYQNSESVMRENIEQIKEVNPSLADEMENKYLSNQESIYYKVSPYVYIAGTLISLLGLIMMSNTTSNGLIFYSIGEIIPYLGVFINGVSSIHLIGVDNGSSNFYGILLYLIMLLIDCSFIYFYYINVWCLNVNNEKKR